MSSQTTPTVEETTKETKETTEVTTLATENPQTEVENKPATEDKKAPEEPPKDEEKTKEPTKEPASAETLAKDNSPAKPELKSTTPLPDAEPAVHDKKDEPAESHPKAEGEDEKEPKRRSAYHYFVSAQQPILKKENPTLNHLEIVKLISSKWKSLSAEEKAPYEEQVQSDKKRHKAKTQDKEATEPKAPESDHRYSLRNSAMIKDDDLVGKKRGLETEDQEANKKKCVTSEE